MKKDCHFVINTIMFLLIVSLVNMGIYLYNIGVVRYTDTMGILSSYTDEELENQYNNSEEFTKSLEQSNTSIVNDKEELSKLDANSDEYKKLTIEIKNLERYKYEKAVCYALLMSPIKSVIRNEVVVADIVMVALYALGMCILAKVETKKETKKKTTKRNKK